MLRLVVLMSCLLFSLGAVQPISNGLNSLIWTNAAQIDDSDLDDEERQLMGIEYRKDAMCVEPWFKLIPGAGWGLLYTPKDAGSRSFITLSPRLWTWGCLYVAHSIPPTICNHGGWTRAQRQCGYQNIERDPTAEPNR